MAGKWKITVTGVESIDGALMMIAAEDGPKSINGAMRKGIRDAIKTIVVPKIKELIAVNTGFLEDQIKVWAIKRSRKSVGIFAGFKDPLFQGDTFYGGYIEFGWDHVRGMHIEADSFLRRALYPQANLIILRVRQHMAKFVEDWNRAKAA